MKEESKQILADLKSKEENHQQAKSDLSKLEALMVHDVKGKADEHLSSHKEVNKPKGKRF